MSNTLDLMRRRIALAQAKLDNYAGSQFGIISGSYVFEDIIMCLSPFIAIPANCTSILVSGDFNNGRFSDVLCDSSQQYVNYQTVLSKARRRTFTAGTYAYIRFILTVDGLDDAYVKDETNNQYLWKGDNVQ